MPCVSKVFGTNLPVLRGEMDCMDVYWRRSAEMHILKQTARHCVPFVSKVFMTKLPALRGWDSSYLTQWWHYQSFETVGHLIDYRCRRMLQNCVHVAHGIAWRSVEWPLFKHMAYHSVSPVSKRSDTMGRELRDEAMNWVFLKHTVLHTTDFCHQ